MRITLIAGLLVAAVAVAAEPGASRSECTADAQCVITDFAGCCGGCCRQARAMSKAQLGQEQRRCAVIDCAAPMCAAVKCESLAASGSLEAKCSAGRCVAVSREAPAECKADRDCAITYPQPGPSDACRSSPCGCCPGSQPIAQPVDKVEHEQRRTTPLTRGGAPVQQHAEPAKGYGLSEGHTNGPTPPSCSPCPGQIPARAVCQQSRCAAVIRPALRE